MKRLVRFLKTTVLGGLLVIIPILLVWVLIGKVFGKITGLVAPLVERMPVEQLGGVAVASILALLLILAVCFVAGLTVRTTIGSRLMSRLETVVLERLPGYKIMNRLTRQFSGASGGDETMFVPAVLSLAQDSLQLVYVIEDHGNGFSTVMMPSAPAAVAGPVHYVRSDRLRRLDQPLAQVVHVLQTYGIGAKPLFAPEEGEGPASSPSSSP